MTILARRRIGSMLQELAPLLGAAKARDLVRRPNNRMDVDQALPAEMELLLLLAPRSFGEIEIEPEWWGDGQRPDAVSDDLVPFAGKQPTEHGRQAGVIPGRRRSQRHRPLTPRDASPNLPLAVAPESICRTYRH